MEAAELLRTLRQRRDQYLEDIRKIDVAIEQIKAAVQAYDPAAEVLVPPPVAGVIGDAGQVPVKPGRVPLATRRAALRSYLFERGPSLRAQILADTRIPPGTLSVLLNEPEFVSTQYGKWYVRGGDLPPTEDGSME